MTLQEKYRGVLNLGEEMKARNAFVKEDGGKLRYNAVVDNQHEKDQLWDEIKRSGGENPRDIEADIKVTNTAYYAKHTVQKGDSLSKMAKEYYGDPMDYKRIFQANTDVLENPNMIYPGQELVIPFPEGRSPDQ
ncbi:nucleoid-associated protein YgaU [Lewinella marina]|uniref:Peptidoglycan-binding protein n=1 Tax=Neolewinella marina TaxID=438751 RepID=A0A2G0CJD3_9BACT|nr:LysM peptidoglycan-binding domain-containing protein [Neolewinella marina]NJB84754.1 nucleoid-associated protein YgaU [Neolewinella marina]PHL00087.1 peptidoglycan-binding protein [Neolewinella marina]